MMRTLLGCAVLLGVLAMPVWADEPQPGVQSVAAMERQIVVKLNYLVYLPADYASQERWPLLVFLHGAGERGSDLEQVKRHGPPKLIAAGKAFPMIVISPQCPAGTWWRTDDLIALLDEAQAKYHVDPDRIYVTGLSMGGFGTFALAAQIPDRLAAIVPICGGGEAYWADRFAKLPTWVFHGEKDSVVPFDRSQKMVEALKRVGCDVKFTAYPNAGHDSWTEAYNTPELFEWILQQKRGQ